MIEYKVLENVNGYGASFWKVTRSIGKSWLHDKTHHELLGYIVKSPDSDYSKLWQTNTYWDEDTNEVIEDNVLVGEFDTEQEAIKFGKKQFFGEK